MTTAKPDRIVGNGGGIVITVAVAAVLWTIAILFIF